MKLDICILQTMAYSNHSCSVLFFSCFLFRSESKRSVPLTGAMTAFRLELQINQWQALCNGAEQ